MIRAAVTMSQAFLLAAVATAGCGPEPVDMPVPPFEQETNAIVASYEMPTGTLDTAKLEQTADEARARLEDLNLDWLPNLLSEALVRLKTRFNDEGLPSDPAAPAEEERARVQAVVNLTRVCRGWDDPAGPIDAAQNGSIELTAVVDATQLRRQAWGTATGCHGRLDPIDTPVLENTALGQGVNGFLDGSLIIYLYGPLPSTARRGEFPARLFGHDRTSRPAEVGLVRLSCRQPPGRVPPRCPRRRHHRRRRPHQPDPARQQRYSDL